MTEITKLKNELAADIDALRAPEGYLYAGIPNFNHLFGRDACVSALQLLDFDQEIAKSTLEGMVRYRAKGRGLMNEAFPGKMLHEHFPGGLKQKLSSLINDDDKLRKLYILLLWRFPYYGTIDAGAWFIILMHRYFKKTGDEKFLRQMWPAALGIVSWLEARVADRPSGLVMYRREYILGLRSQSWKDAIGSVLEPPVAMVEVQGYYYEAYNCLAELAVDVFGDSASAEQFARKAETLKASFNRLFWQGQAGYFSLAVNEQGDHDDTVASNPGHLLFTGILNDEQTKSAVGRLMSGDMRTPYGIRTLSASEKSFDADSYQRGSVWPFDNWVIYQGMLKAGYETEAHKIKGGLLAVHEKFGSIPELYTVSKDSNHLARYPEACTIQAWSAGALIDMITRRRPVL